MKLRILIWPHELVTGGSQINAIDLAAELGKLGHEVELFAPPGPLVSKIEALGVSYRPAPQTRGGLDLRILRAFGAEMRRFEPDIVHTFESSPSIHSSIAAFRRPQRNVTTIMSMSVPAHIPAHVPLTVGTGALSEGQAGRAGQVYLWEPPVDTEFDAPGDTVRAREVLGLDPERAVISVVGRLSAEHQKARGIVAALDTLAATADLPPVTVIVAGAGDEESLVVQAAARANEHPNIDVRLLGNVPDPRPVYDAADIVFGMGGSALRAMSHAKPVIVQGRDGFWLLLSPETAPQFRITGYFGEGTSGGPTFGELVTRLIAQPIMRDQLGQFGRELVVADYSLAHAARLIESIYLEEVDADRSRASVRRSLNRAYLRYAKFRVALAAPWLQDAFRAVTGRHE
ncbi:MAG: glycosyltransferase family 4 protein [Microthrixaceae bacterium]|nr:glycosyltransferase family 4 protein [Microthrixaceae bacterium]